MKDERWLNNNIFISDIIDNYKINMFTWSGNPFPLLWE